MEQTNQVGCELKITEKAATEFVSMVHQEEKDLKESYLRVGAKSGGCSGWKYSLNYEDTVDSTDLIFEQHGIKMVVDDELLNNIMGDVEVDYKVGNLVEQGFVFKRLKFGHQCGCGESFTPLKDMKNGKEQLGWK
jgi:iron-sulfur cluster assembly protein